MKWEMLVKQNMMFFNAKTHAFYAAKIIIKKTLYTSMLLLSHGTSLFFLFNCLNLTLERIYMIER